jgi:hypothetical protein
LLTAIGLTPGDSSTVHIYTKTIHRTTQSTCEECGQCPVFASYTLAFVLQLGKKREKASVRVAEEYQLAKKYTEHIYVTIRIIRMQKCNNTQLTKLKNIYKI